MEKSYLDPSLIPYCYGWEQLNKEKNVAQLILKYTQQEIEQIVLEYARNRHASLEGYQTAPGHGEVTSTITAGSSSGDPREHFPSSVNMEVTFDETEYDDRR